MVQSRRSDLWSRTVLPRDSASRLSVEPSLGPSGEPYLGPRYCCPEAGYVKTLKHRIDYEEKNAAAIPESERFDPQILDKVREPLLRRSYGGYVSSSSRIGTSPFRRAVSWFVSRFNPFVKNPAAAAARPFHEYYRKHR